MRWITLVCLLSLLQVGSALAQATGRVTGRVTSDAGQPLAGASVVVAGTRLGTLTGQNGQFIITGVPAGTHTLRATLIGHSEQTRQVTVAADQAASVNFQLQAQAVELEGVVAVGYGTVRRQNVTGAVAQVTAETVEDRPIARVEQALAGQMAGVQVRQPTGEPGAPLEVRVRGSASISAGNNPLYVIDGVPVDDLGSLNPSDIQSIEVLKDAASAAIYGSRGANGVVLVTTKSGTSGAPRFQVSTSQGVSVLEKKLDVLSAAEWIDLYQDVQNANWVRLGQQRNRNYQASDPISFRQQELGRLQDANYIPDPRWAFGCDSVACIDWQDEFYRPAPFSTYEISAAGATGDLRYRISGGYLNQEGIAAYTGYDRVNLQANFDVQLSERVQLGLNLSPSFAWGEGGNVTGKDQVAHRLVSIAPVAEPDAGVMTGVKPYDRYYFAGSTVSPLGFQEHSTNETQDKRLLSKLFIDAELLEGLELNVTGAWNSIGYANNIYYPTMVQPGSVTLPDGTRSDGRFRTNNSDQYLAQSTLNYQRILGDHDFNAIAGASTEYFELRSSYQRNTQFADDLLRVINNSTSAVTNSETSALERSLVSYFGRLMYAYQGKYLATVSLRRDGSSKFGENNKWGLFPAVSLGWRVSEEPFLDSVDWLSNLKLRGSWGVIGNNQIPDYAYFGSLGVYNTSFGNALAVGYGPSSLSNANLGWEQTRSVDVGLDLGLFDEQISFTTDYYNKLTTDLLLRVPVALSTGFSTGWQNIGQVRNEGLEFEVAGRTGFGGLQWEPSANLAFNRNEVVKLGPGDAPIYTGFSGQTAIIQVGEPLMAYYMYDAIGVYMNQQDLENSPRMPNNIVGDVKYRDVNGDGKITTDDRTILGHRDPSYSWGVTNRLSYSAFDLSFLLQGQGGNKIYGILGRAIDRPGQGPRTQALGRWRDRWRSEAEPGDGRTPRYNGTTGGLYDSRWLYDASYVSLRNVTLGYRIPERLLRGLGPTRIYLTGENVFRSDDYYGGYSPEADNNSGGDYGGYPTARTFTIGLTTSF